MGGVGVANNKRSRYRGVTLFKQSGKFRAQISSNGKTTSLGDHLTEEEAARAFDRACIHRSGTDANTNFPLSDYATELQALQSMSQRDLVAMLRASARRQVTQTSVYMGVSLLRQTGRWHSQISWHTTISSRETILNLGYYASEEAAARAYDRAALIKATTTAAGRGPEIKSEKNHTNDVNEEEDDEARPSSSSRPHNNRASTPPALNFPPSNYASDAQLPAALLLSALIGDSTRKLVMDMLDNGITEEDIGHLNRMLTEGGGGGGENQKRKIKGVNGNGGGLDDGFGEGSSGSDDGHLNRMLTEGGGGGGGGGGIVKSQAAAIVEAAIAAEGRLGELLANGSHPNNMQLHTPPVLFNSMLEVGGGLLSSGNGGGGGSESSRKRRKTTRPARSHAN